MLSIIFYEIDGILVWFGFCSVPPKRKSEEEKVYLTYSLLSIIKRSQGRSWRQEPKQSSRRRAAYHLSALLSCLPYTGQARLPKESSELGPPTSVINQENVPESGPRANLMEAIAHLRIPPPGVSITPVVLYAAWAPPMVR